jgi:hypothetical protein
MALTPKKLDKIEKSLEALMAGDPEEFAAVKKTLAGVRLAMEAGETFSKAELNELLGGAEVEVTQVEDVTKGDDISEEDHPMGPIMLDLFKSLFADDGTIRKGVTMQTAQQAFEKAYQASADVFDVAINAAVEATAIELGATQPATIGKGKKKPVTGEDEDCEDMEKAFTKLLKGSPAGLSLLKKMADLETTVQTLQSERDTTVFAKQAADIGEPAAFGADLAKLHKLDPELAKVIQKKLGVKNELIAKSAAWGQELGSAGGNGGEGGTAYEQLNSAAREKVSKSDGKLTLAKAFTMICGEQPELYQRYQDEQRAARR